MKTSVKLLAFLLTLLVLSACQQKSEIERILEDRAKLGKILDEAEKSSVTELNTPDGFRFNMTESEFNKVLASHESPLVDSLTELKFEPGRAKYDWLFGSEHYAVDSHTLGEFKDGKMYSYTITLWGRIANNEFFTLTESDINDICVFYKGFLKENYTFDSLLTRSSIEGKTYVFTKNNLAITINDDLDEVRGKIEITYENRPVSAPIERERQAAYEKNHPETYSSTPTHTVEVKNSGWDGSVKQVKDYLKYTLRDPDSYESIEWSVVKEKSDGYYVRHKYRAKNGFGGYVVANQLFHLDFSGNVVDVKDLY